MIEFHPRIEAFPIEAGHIKLFARAIGDPNPIYSDPAYAAGTPLGGIIAPPTFVEAGIHYNEDFPLRPRPGMPWLGSAAEPSGLPPGAAAAGTDLHAETHFDYRRQLRPGMVLHSRTRPGKSWEKAGGRAGLLRFFEMITDYLDADGEVTVVARAIGVRTEKKVGQPPLPAALAGPRSLLDLPERYPPTPLRAAGLRPGDRRTSIVAVNLSRVQIVMYAGATGDFSPQHVDEVYNTRAAGYPTVFGHGMLTMAATARMLTDWVGDGRLRTFGFRFRQQVWPGDDIVASAEVRAIERGEHPLAELSITTTNQHGAVLGTGYAVARIDP